MNNTIGIIITTFLRDELLYKSINSILENWQSNFKLIIIDQGNVDILKKSEFMIKNLNDNCFYYNIPFNSGLSYTRNYGVQKAKEFNCKYILMASDSFLMNNTLNKLNEFTEILNNKKFDLIGFELSNCCCDWEAKLNLIENKSFELNFIEKKYNNTNNQIFECDICRNFFLTSTEKLLNIKWDEDLMLGEHEDFFWRWKQNNYKVGWTKEIYTDKLTDRPAEYLKFRKENFRLGKNKMIEKYNLSSWVTYKNLDRAKHLTK